MAELTDPETGIAHLRHRKVGIADHYVSDQPVLISTSGLGSCIATAIYDQNQRLGGLVHSMIPESDSREPGNPAKYTDSGIQLLIDGLLGLGATRSDLVAKLAGGSEMLKFSNGDGSIGKRNLETAYHILEAANIHIAERDVGGQHGRSVRFSTADGTFAVRCQGTVKLL